MEYKIASLRVHFRAKSIHLSYLNIMKGNYEDISNIYSNYLRNIIRFILCLGPGNLLC